MARKMLLVVEGAKAEPRLIKRLLEVYGLDADYEIVPYKTNIHVLYSDMFSNREDVGMLTLTDVLKERETEPEKRDILNQDYSDVLLIFDYDPQDDKFDSGHLLEMQSYFNESTDEGKLFINYPMVESCRHFSRLPDPDFLNRKTGECKQYKKVVNNETCRQDVSKLTKEDMDLIISMVLQKSLTICNKAYNANDAEGNLENLDLLEVLGMQNREWEQNDMVWVLGTCPLFICDYSIGLVDFV